MKRCSKCTGYKPESDFYVRNKDTGSLYGQCIQCMKGKDSESYQANRDERIKSAKEYQKKHPDKHLRANQKYNQVNARERAFRAQLFRDVSPEKIAARNAVGYAVRSGKIKKPLRCQRCNQIRIIEGHHQDYSKPLEVIWLCKICHMILHKGQ